MLERQQVFAGNQQFQQASHPLFTSVGREPGKPSLPMRPAFVFVSGHGRVVAWKLRNSFIMSALFCVMPLACIDYSKYCCNQEEPLRNDFADAALEGTAPKPKKTIGKIKVQVRKVKIMPDMPSRCSFQSCRSSLLNMESLRSRFCMEHKKRNKETCQSSDGVERTTHSEKTYMKSCCLRWICVTQKNIGDEALAMSMS